MVLGVSSELQASENKAATGQSAASQARDSMLGKRLFFKCRACHTLGEGEGNLVGPNLHGLIGNKAGSRKDYSYSPALLNSGIVWNEKTLDEWIKKPHEMVPGTTMVFTGIDSEEERAVLIRHIVYEVSK